MAEGRFIGYVRVSTEEQGRSGLGLEAQMEAINRYLNGGTWELLQVFREIESGKRSDREQLKAALEACKRTGSTLLIAKLDRLSRNVVFIASLMESGVPFVACDLPHANKFTVHILAAVAEHEHETISRRTKEALQAARARGTKLGNPMGLKPDAARHGRTMGRAVRVQRADAFAVSRYEHIQAYRNQGLSLNEIARRLNADGTLTAKGHAGTWTARAVLNVVNRVEGLST